MIEFIWDEDGERNLEIMLRALKAQHWLNAKRHLKMIIEAIYREGCEHNRLLNLMLDGIDDGSITMTAHRRDQFDGIYREHVEAET